MPLVLTISSHPCENIRLSGSICEPDIQVLCDLFPHTNHLSQTSHSCSL